MRTSASLAAPAAALLAGPVGTPAPAQDRPPRARDSLEIRALAPGWEHSWNAHDVTRFAAPFTDDADFVNVGGRHLKGRALIEEQRARLHATQFRASVPTNGVPAVQFLTPATALVHLDWSMRADVGSPRCRRTPSTDSSSPGLGRTRSTC
jgi:uncharacterized protein (TIGR02246 family)